MGTYQSSVGQYSIVSLDMRMRSRCGALRRCLLRFPIRRRPRRHLSHSPFHASVDCAHNVKRHFSVIEKATKNDFNLSLYKFFAFKSSKQHPKSFFIPESSKELQYMYLLVGGWHIESRSHFIFPPLFLSLPPPRHSLSPLLLSNLHPSPSGSSLCAKMQARA